MHPFACGNPNRQILGHQAKERRPASQFLEKTLMRKIIAGALFMALAGTLTVAAPQRDRDDRHDNGKHKGQEKHQDRGDDRHDNGKHQGRDNPQIAHYRNWDSEHERLRPGRAYPHGRYEHVKAEFVARRIDYRTRRVVLYDNSNWVVASYDLDHCRDWEWNRDRVYVYDDDHHPGWYLLFNARLGRYVHVEYFGLQ